MFNDIINSDIAGLLGRTADKLTGKDGYNIASEAMALLEEIIKLGKDPNGNNYDNTIALIANLINLGDEPLGRGTMIDKYAEMCTRSALKSLLDVIGLDFGINDDVVLECAKNKNYDVIIPWEEGPANTKSVPHLNFVILR